VAFLLTGEKMKQNSCRRITLLVITQFLVFPCLVFSSSTPLSDLNIPAKIGNIKEVFETNPDASSNGKTVIEIQDAHCNYEAQKNMAQILEYLIASKNLKLIMVEGGSGDVSLSFLRSYADKKTREEVADKYLRQGKISGEEYLDIVSDHPIELFGVEDQALYDANLNAFLEEEDSREQGIKDLEAFSQAVLALSPYIYNQELKDFEAKRAEYGKKALSLTDYCKYLKEIAGAKRLDLRDSPHLSAFVEIALTEKDLNFKEAEAQRNLFIKELAKALDEQEVKELIAKTREFKEQKSNGRDYYSYLQEKAQFRIDLARDYPQLNSYISYIKVSKDINAADLIKEIAVLENNIREALFVNNDERELARISKAVEVLSGFLKLDLTPEEYEDFNKEKSQYTTVSWVDFLSDSCRKHNLDLQLQASTAIDENIQKLEEFYKLGLSREEAFIKNLTAKLEESKEQLVVLITGGFHTPGVTRMLKEKGYSYAVVAPAITERTDSSLYFSVLRGEKKYAGDAVDERDYSDEE
jgi:hypothetical protein